MEFDYFYREKNIKDKSSRLLERDMQSFVLQDGESWKEGWGNLDCGNSPPTRLPCISKEKGTRNNLTSQDFL